MVFWVAMVFVFVSLMLIAIGLIMSMGLMATGQVFGAGRSEEMQRNTDSTHTRVLSVLSKCC